MTREEFIPLKEFCDNNGYELLNTDHEDNEKFFVIAKKKDPWAGVEFFNTPKGIYPLKKVSSDRVFSTHERLGDYRQFLIEKCTPSTESAYIEQLKKEAFERFGEIKEGDRFDRSEMSIDSVEDIGIIFKTGFEYFKNEDCFEFGGTIIYQAGKWAIKLPKRVEIKPCMIIRNDNTGLHEFTFTSNKRDILMSAGEFLSKQLEKFLNGEIK